MKKIVRYLRNLLRSYQKKSLPRCPVEPTPISLKEGLLIGKTGLVTGAGSNIGRSIALELAKQGANILFIDIDALKCAQLTQELSAYPIRSQGFTADITNPQDIEQIYEFIIKEQISIDILVNNVGILLEQDHTTFELDLIHKTFDTNFFGPLLLTKKISQQMIMQQIAGNIIFITSIHQSMVAGWLGYSSSKAALTMAIKELASSLARHNIRVNGIAPGWVIEDQEGIPLKDPASPLYQSSINPDYIGRAAIFLASNYFSRFTTGTILTVDAGLSLYSHRLKLD